MMLTTVFKHTGQLIFGVRRLSKATFVLGFATFAIVGIFLVLSPIKGYKSDVGALPDTKQNPRTQSSSLASPTPSTATKPARTTQQPTPTITIHQKEQIAQKRFLKEVSAAFARDNWNIWMQNSSEGDTVTTYRRIDGQTLFKPRFPGDDRIQDTLNYIPDGYKKGTGKDKLILLWHDYTWNMEKYSVCLVDSCSITRDKTRLQEADAVVFHQPGDWNIPIRNRNIPQSQVWIMSYLECPYSSYSMKKLNGFFNWTATYRSDSTFPYVYGKFLLHNETMKSQPQAVNYAAGKTKKIAWIVSNCSPNWVRNTRIEYAKELGEHVQVDIYGTCGRPCPGGKTEKCNEYIQKHYKFYLSFENSNCREYITEKLFHNALSYNVLPIVMGAHPDDYKRVAPYNSFIHVDDFESPKHLADYLDLLDQNEDLYNQYFSWKGTGSLVSGESHKLIKWCQLCALLHAPRPTLVVDNPQNWWHENDVCTKDDTWQKHGYKPLGGDLIKNALRYLNEKASDAG